MNSLAYIYGPPVLTLDLYEAPGFRTGRSMKHKIREHDSIMQRCNAKPRELTANIGS